MQPDNPHSFKFRSGKPGFPLPHNLLPRPATRNFQSKNVNLITVLPPPCRRRHLPDEATHILHQFLLVDYTMTLLSEEASSPTLSGSMVEKLFRCGVAPGSLLLALMYRGCNVSVRVCGILNYSVK